MIDQNIISILEARDLNAGYNSLSDIPHFSKMRDMTKGAKRLSDAIRDKEHICLVGDYDADGVSATVVCVSFFADIGYPIDWRIPDRFRVGYGVSPSVLEDIEDADVIFTVDNGIVAHGAADVCRERGIDLIITDHHTAGAMIPDCYAVINPKQKECEYPFKDGSGCFVAWMLCCAIKQELGLDINMGRYLDLVALSTVTDVMPMVGINRHIVKYGLRKINEFRRPFFRDLALSLGKDSFGYEDLGFQIGPRINAAGRLEHASLAVEALLAGSDQVQRHVLSLTQINQRRKEIQSDMVDSIMDQAQSQEDFVVVHSDSLHEGVVGIVAAKVAESTGYPTIILATAKDGLLKGSGRTVGAVDIFDILSRCSMHLEKYGGHAGACGLSLRAENLDTFGEAIRAAARRLPREDFEPLDTAIGELNPADTDLNLYYQIEEFAPFGAGNIAPVFECKEATINSSKAVGKEGNHTRLSLSWGGIEVNVMAFNSNANHYPRGSKVSFHYRLDLNRWNGNVNLQFMPIGEVKIKNNELNS